MARLAVQRGLRVNREPGNTPGAILERHDAGDFDRWRVAGLDFDMSGRTRSGARIRKELVGSSLEIGLTLEAIHLHFAFAFALVETPDQSP